MLETEGVLTRLVRAERVTRKDVNRRVADEAPRLHLLSERIREIAGTEDWQDNTWAWQLPRHAQEWRAPGVR
jgi:hypothetical protein